MATKPRIAIVTADGCSFPVEIPLSDDDYMEFQNGEHSAIEYVLTIIREKNSSLAERDFGYEDVHFLVPQ